MRICDTEQPISTTIDPNRAPINACDNSRLVEEIYRSGMSFGEEAAALNHMRAHRKACSFMLFRCVPISAARLGVDMWGRPIAVWYVNTANQTGPSDCFIFNNNVPIGFGTDADY